MTRGFVERGMGDGIDLARAWWMQAIVTGTSVTMRGPKMTRGKVELPARDRKIKLFFG
jgi:hypothetical protein